MVNYTRNPRFIPPSAPGAGRRSLLKVDKPTPKELGIQTTQDKLKEWVYIYFIIWLFWGEHSGLDVYWIRWLKNFHHFIIYARISDMFSWVSLFFFQYLNLRLLRCHKRALHCVSEWYWRKWCLDIFYECAILIGLSPFVELTKNQPCVSIHLKLLTRYYQKKKKNRKNRKTSAEIKVCCLLFISGILTVVTLLWEKVSSGV